MAIQRRRETRAEAARWLRQLLRERNGSRLDTLLPQARGRLSRWSHSRRAALVRRDRAAVDGFEIALGDAGKLTNPDARAVLGILESSQSNDALGNRLVTLFQASRHEILGLAIASEIPEGRLRAVLETNVRGFVAIYELMNRNPVSGVPASLRPVRTLLDGLSEELRQPSSGGVTSSTSAREAAMLHILTPPEVRQRRRAAAASGGPAPSFEPANYFEEILAALHAVIQTDWQRARQRDRARSMDTSPGGHVEGIATEAKTRVDAIFGSYGSSSAPPLQFARPATSTTPASGGNLSDGTLIGGDPFDMARYYIQDAGEDPIETIKTDHNAFEDLAASEAIEGRVIEFYSGRSDPTTASERDAVTRLGVSKAERTERLKLIDRMWGGVASGGNVRIRAREGANPRETRAIYWSLFKTIIHEYLHTTEHPRYKRWYATLDSDHHRLTFQEGFTDLFTRYAWDSVAPSEAASNSDFRRTIQGNTTLDMRAVGGRPGSYSQVDEAEQIEELIGIANMRAAYFRGEVDKLGAGRLPVTP